MDDKPWLLGYLLNNRYRGLQNAIFFAQLTLVVRDDLTTDKWWFDGKYLVLIGCELAKMVI